MQKKPLSDIDTRFTEEFLKEFLQKFQKDSTEEYIRQTLALTMSEFANVYGSELTHAARRLADRIKITFE